MRWLAILVLAVALVAAGCGGGDDESAAPDETTIEETVTEETAEDETSGETTDDDVDLSGVLGDEDCLALASAGAAFAQAFAGAGATDDESAAALEELAGKVPDEIRADVETLGQALAEYAAELEDIGIDAGATPSAEQLQALQAALASFDQEELTAASQRLEAWSQENCTG